MRGQLHTEFETITIHTAKCDICDQHNTSEMFRCTKCGRHCCKPCWDARGGDGRHTVHDKQRLAYTGPVAEPLPSAAKEKEGKDEAKKGKRERKTDAEETKKGGRKKSLIVSLNVGKGKKRARDDGEDDLLEKDESSITSNGPAAGSAAAEHKRRRKASGGYSSSNTSERAKDSTPRKTALTRTSPSTAKTLTPTYLPPTITNPQPRLRQTALHSAKNVPGPEYSAKLCPAPNMPGKANTKVPSTSLSPVTRVLLTQPPPPQRRYHLASATKTLMSLGEGIHTYSDNDDETEDEYEDEDEDGEPHPTPLYHPYATAVNGHPNPNPNTKTHGIISNGNANRNAATAPTPAYATSHSLKQEPPRAPTARDAKDRDGMHSLLSAAQMLETQNQPLNTSPSSSSLLAPHARAHGEMPDSLSEEEEEKRMKKQHANALLVKRLARLDEGSEDEL
ncbi:MAG: hypothetical protein L6R36_000157 [Xanthoria steineri]|nr:MAG: hypothetical protein L6R36_000157 [Xanthoria steineri]